MRQNKKSQVRIAIPVRALKRLAGVFNRVDSIPKRVPEMLWLRELGRRGIKITEILDRQADLPAEINLPSEIWYNLAEAALIQLFGVSVEPSWQHFVKKDVPPLTVEGTSERVHTLLLWAIKTYAGKDVAARIKKCQYCNRWFADVTRNRSRLRCSSRCTWRTWNRPKRREAGHRQYRKNSQGKNLTRSKTQRSRKAARPSGHDR